MNYFELKKNFENLFSQANIEETADIDWIMVQITSVKRSMLPFHKFTLNEVEEITKAINLRIKHIPIGYIFWKTNFYGRDFFVSRDTLIPRIDTEILIELVVKEIEAMTKDSTVLDIGTGTGIVAITINKETGAEVTAVDISENALEIAKKNGITLNSSVKFIKSDLFENLANEKFDIIVSNPPYIKTSVISELEPEVRLNEPLLALDGGEDGLTFYRKILSCAKDYLNKNGKIFFEIGYDQAEDVKKLMEKDFENIMIIKDYSENDRVVYGKLRG